MSDVGEVLGAHNPTTIRERLENQRKQVAVLAQEIRLRVGPNLPDEIAIPLTAIIKDAVAALDQMGKARHAYRCQPGCSDCSIRDEPWRSNDVRVAIIDDPDPGVGAEHAPKEHP